MSTRAAIIIKDETNSIRLYHHHDGYVSGVGFDLLERYRKKLDDTAMCLDIEEIANELVKDSSDEYEIAACLHGDEEYLYTIDIQNREITVQQGFCDDNGEFKVDQAYTYDEIKTRWEEA